MIKMRWSTLNNKKRHNLGNKEMKTLAKAKNEIKKDFSNDVILY